MLFCLKNIHCLHIFKLGGGGVSACERTFQDGNMGFWDPGGLSNEKYIKLLRKYMMAKLHATY